MFENNPINNSQEENHSDNENVKKKEKLELWYMDFLEQPMKTLIEKLRDRIESGDYKYIIGDDASGRIPALIFQRFLKKIYGDKGLDGPEIYFIAGSGSERPALLQILKKRKLRKYIGSYKNEHEINGKVLVITECIASGAGMRPLVSVLTELGIDFDIASVGKMLGYDYNDAVKEMGHEFWYGEVGPSSIYGKMQASGVEKKPGDLLSTRYSEAGNEVSTARHDINILVNKLYNWYTEKK